MSSECFIKRGLRGLRRLAGLVDHEGTKMVGERLIGEWSGVRDERPATRDEDSS